MTRFLLLALFLPTLGSAGIHWGVRSAAAVLEGTVLERAGLPVSSARVELWDGEGRLASGRTDAEGRFVLETEKAWAEDWRVLVDRLGYFPLETPVPRDALSLELVLDPAPIPVTGFRVEGDRDFCNAREDREARTLWARASARAEGGLDTLGIASYTTVRVDTITTGVMGAPGLAGAEAGQRSSAPLLRLSWDRRVRLDGYAFSVRRIDSDQSYDSWGYPPLEADFAPHFASETFGRLHTFHLEAGDRNGWILHFCGRNRDDPYLEGALEVGPDTLMRRVEWRFHTEEPDEVAGGWAGFAAPTEPGTPQLLLPTESVTWRTLPNGEVVRRAQWYEGWITVVGDSVPLLPNRTAAVAGDEG